MICQLTFIDVVADELYLGVGVPRPRVTETRVAAEAPVAAVGHVLAPRVHTCAAPQLGPGVVVRGAGGVDGVLSSSFTTSSDRKLFVRQTE